MNLDQTLDLFAGFLVMAVVAQVLGLRLKSMTFAYAVSLLGAFTLAMVLALAFGSEPVLPVAYLGGAVSVGLTWAALQGRAPTGQWIRDGAGAIATAGLLLGLGLAYRWWIVLVVLTLLFLGAFSLQVLPWGRFRDDDPTAWPPKPGASPKTPPRVAQPGLPQAPRPPPQQPVASARPPNPPARSQPARQKPPSPKPSSPPPGRRP